MFNAIGAIFTALTLLAQSTHRWATAIDNVGKMAESATNLGVEEVNAMVEEREAERAALRAEAAKLLPNAA